MSSSVFQAMGTEIRLITPGEERGAHAEILRAVAALFAGAERRFSRFDEESELSRLNRATRPVIVSALLFEALTRAKRHFEVTRGLFDPAVGSDLLAAGYVRSFAPGALDRWTPVSPAMSHPSFAELDLDPATHRVRRPPGLLLDLGGLVKGWTVDRAARLLPANSVLDAGGDLLLRGTGEEGEGWLLDVEDPFDAARVVRTLRVAACAVATSGVGRRRWLAGGEEQHHLIDPRTRRPSRSDLSQVTVVGDSVEQVEVLAKTVLLLGAREGTRWLRRHEGIAGVLVRRDRSVDTVGALDMIEEVAA
ncbi:MAG: FAD:protein FMN transferase [Byssovorax sp.]